MNKQMIIKHPTRLQYWSGLEWTEYQDEAKIFTPETGAALIHKRWNKGLRQTDMRYGVCTYSYADRPKLKVKPRDRRRSDEVS